jgi:thiamine-phosphate diphosphorylase
MSSLSTGHTTAAVDARRERRARVRGVYLLVGPEESTGKDPLQVARAALEGGVRMVQLRDKRERGYVLPLARALRSLCAEFGALFIVNDHVDIAVLSDADGVHLGQKDLPPQEARRLLPADRIIGVSTALVEEALQAVEAGADYVAVGSIYPSPSKEDTRPAGLETLRQVRAKVALPLVAIGGITEENVEAVREAGADAVAVISAIVGAEDVRAAAQRLVARFEKRAPL